MLGTTAWVLRRGNSSRLTTLFIICLLSIALWLISQLLILFSNSRDQLWLSYIIGNGGICFFSTFWLMFAAEYSDVDKRIKKLSNILPLVSAVMFGCIAANPMHHLYYTEFGKGNILYGGMFYIFQIIFYIFIISGISMMFIRHTQRNDVVTAQTMLLALAAAVPLMVNILSVIGIIRSKIEVTPLCFAFSVIMILIAISRYGLLNVNRIAINDTIDKIAIAVIVFDEDDNMTYKNKMTDNIIQLEENTTLPEFRKKMSELSGVELDDETISKELKIGDEYYNLRQSVSVNKKGAEIARIIMINNVSEYYELAAAEKKLSLELERNRIAQEIHDSAGHTFTMISSLAKILQVEAQNIGSDSQIEEYISEIDGLSRSGVTQLRCSINNLRDDEFMTSVTRAIQTVATAMRNIDVEICIQGEEDDSFAFCIREIYENTREILTNAMRYSGADRIDIIVKFLSDRLELYIFDNGNGTEIIKENNGLSGIRSRTEAIGGSVRFSSVKGEGFTTVIKIPKSG